MIRTSNKIGEPGIRNEGQLGNVITAFEIKGVRMIDNQHVTYTIAKHLGSEIGNIRIGCNYGGSGDSLWIRTIYGYHRVILTWMPIGVSFRRNNER